MTSRNVISVGVGILVFLSVLLGIGLVRLYGDSVLIAAVAGVVVAVVIWVVDFLSDQS